MDVDNETGQSSSHYETEVKQTGTMRQSPQGRGRKKQINPIAWKTNLDKKSHIFF